ncbi:hypothetical protein [Sulfuricurvum sp.]|uniref:hypothetical protein n=1 Tax=Sulfuricurvum sp. TaxID=2025608 RepID=UPI00262C6CA6|nr:hypothetical protein [Sulfuricurvum sp.]MDD4883060.1 hypothetical protein [Sulfuricurvum sp.]
MNKNKTYEMLEMCCQIESSMKRPIAHLEKLGQVEEAKVLKIIKEKYKEIIFSHMRKNNIPKMTFSISRHSEVEYTNEVISGEKNGN